MSFQCKAWYLSHRGKVRPGNEDSLLLGDKIVTQGDMTEPDVWESEEAGSFCVCVADGMGGHKAGERASALCCEGLAQMDDESEEQLQERLLELHRSIHEESNFDPNCRGMGTTVAGLAFLGEDLRAFNVGDSRVYRIQDQSLNQITKDDTIAQAMEEAGMWKPGEVRPAGFHGLTQALGGSMAYREIVPQTHDCPLENRASYLLCTDGLTDMLSLDQMEEGLSLEKPELILDGLFEAAMGAGGKDNLTIICLEVERRP